MADRGWKVCCSVVLLLAAFAVVNARASSAGTNEAPYAYSLQNATNPVEVVRDDWFDAKRDRKLPVKIYFPKSGDGPFPVILFSHGLGGSREGYEYLGRCWASHGYVSVHLQHPGSDAAVLQGTNVAEMMANLRKAAATAENAVNRPLDVSFAIDQLKRLNREQPQLEHRLDLDRIGAPVVVTEVGMVGAGRNEEGVVRERSPVGRDQPPPGDVDIGRLEEQDPDVVPTAEDGPERLGDVAGRDGPGGDLVEQRLEQVEIAPVDERHREEWIARKLAGGVQAGEAAAHHDGAVTGGQRGGMTVGGDDGAAHRRSPVGR